MLEVELTQLCVAHAVAAKSAKPTFNERRCRTPAIGRPGTGLSEQRTSETAAEMSPELAQSTLQGALQQQLAASSRFGRPPNCDLLSDVAYDALLQAARVQ